MEFKHRLKELRKASGITAAQLGKKLGVSRSAISNWENGNNQPNNSLLIELSKIFDCSIDFLLGNSDTHYSNITITQMTNLQSSEKKSLMI